MPNGTCIEKVTSSRPCVAFFFVTFVVAFEAAAQGKKVYISVDLEGISGVGR